jgi:23S rRNA pseudouridine2605 synthase
MGYQVNPGDEVRYNNEILRGEKLVYLLLNKPKDYITTVDDPSQRHTVMELISGACRERIYPVGRLDRNTTGVLLFTNDGELVRRLLHPSFNVQKVYHVSLSKSLKPDEFQKISDGVYLDDGLVKVDDIAYAGDGTDRKEIGIELHSGRNRVVRRIFEHFGHEVVKLDRTVFAGLTKKDLPRGRYRMLTSMEIANLKMMVGGKRYREAMLNEE